MHCYILMNIQDFKHKLDEIFASVATSITALV